MWILCGNHYSVSKQQKRKTSHTPGGVMGKRPDYACVIVYGNLIRQTYKKTPVILGGIEASLQEIFRRIMTIGQIISLRGPCFCGIPAPI
ncbi:MAG: hypothetical protein ACLUUO_08110 [Sellimonas intestinalis]